MCYIFVTHPTFFLDLALLFLLYLYVVVILRQVTVDL